MTRATTPTSWFHNKYVHSQNRAVSNLPSRSEIVFLLDSGASISLLSLPTYKMITQKLNVCNYDTSKTLTIANQSEVPNEQYNSVTCSHQKKQNQDNS